MKPTAFPAELAKAPGATWSAGTFPVAAATTKAAGAATAITACCPAIDRRCCTLDCLTTLALDALVVLLLWLVLGFALRRVLLLLAAITGIPLRTA